MYKNDYAKKIMGNKKSDVKGVFKYYDMFTTSGWWCWWINALILDYVWGYDWIM